MNNIKGKLSSVIAAASFTLLLGITGSPAPAPASGQNIFKEKCAMCHGPDGSAKTPMGQRFKIRDLRSAEVQGQTDDQLAAIITNGKPPMPAYGKSLSPADIHELVSYIRSIASKR